VVAPKNAAELRVSKNEPDAKARDKGADKLKVISASRRVDMVSGYRGELMEVLSQDWPPEKVHTVVIWTKNPPALASDTVLKEFLARYDQVFLHLTITGLGGTPLEPAAPPWRDSVAALPALVDFAGSPARIRLRFDPLLKISMADGNTVSNASLFEEVAGAGVASGVRDVSISWVTSYGKVHRRLAARAMKILDKDPVEMDRLWTYIYGRAEKLGVTLHACCVPGLLRSRCIDGELLNRLHPKGYKCSTRRARDQRRLCGCTESFDVGWYKSCPTGCLYCYANPAVP
jgi:DNA repair photolyase